MSKWTNVEWATPEDRKPILMMDSQGKQSAGWFQDGVFRFNYWGSGDPIEYWRYDDTQVWGAQ